jgi:hypothetical protein
VAAGLRAVAPSDNFMLGETVPTEPEDLLAIIVPELLRAEQTVRRFEQLMDQQRPRLAAKRGVAFIRREHVLQEFRPKPKPGAVA